jgi:hypothetical protein
MDMQQVDEVLKRVEDSFRRKEEPQDADEAQRPATRLADGNAPAGGP